MLSRPRQEKLVVDLVQLAKSETLDKLGEGRQALDIAAGWVRSKVGNTAVSGSNSPSPMNRSWMAPPPVRSGPPRKGVSVTKAPLYQIHGTSRARPRQYST